MSNNSDYDDTDYFLPIIGFVGCLICIAIILFCTYGCAPQLPISQTRPLAHPIQAIEATAQHATSSLELLATLGVVVCIFGLGLVIESFIGEPVLFKPGEFLLVMGGCAVGVSWVFLLVLPFAFWFAGAILLAGIGYLGYRYRVRIQALFAKKPPATVDAAPSTLETPKA